MRFRITSRDGSQAREVQQRAAWWVEQSELSSPTAFSVLARLPRPSVRTLLRWMQRLDWGPGYRIYFGKDGDLLIILLGGGTKKRQRPNILAALHCWADYKRRKKNKETD